MTPCTNCGATQESKYCGECGQKRVKPGIRLGEVVHETLGTITHFEGPFWYTLRSFFTGPGAMTRRFVAGQRKSIVPPVRYMLVAIGFFYLVRYLFHWDPAQASMPSGSIQDPTPFVAVNLWTSKHVNLLLPILVVLLASFDRLLFPRTALNWSERCVHYIFTVGSYIFVSTLLIPFYLPFPWLQPLGLFVIVGILIAGCISLHRLSILNVVKALLMLPVTYVIYILICMAIAALVLGLPLGQVFMMPGRA